MKIPKGRWCFTPFSPIHTLTEMNNLRKWLRDEVGDHIHIWPNKKPELAKRTFCPLMGFCHLFFALLKAFVLKMWMEIMKKMIFCLKFYVKTFSTDTKVIKWLNNWSPLLKMTSYVGVIKWAYILVNVTNDAFMFSLSSS